MGIKKYVKEPWLIPLAMENRGHGKLIPDSLYLKCAFYSQFGYKLNLRNPKTFNEKLQWLKLHDRRPIYTSMVDKYLVKKYVATQIGEQYIIPTLGVWNSVDEIDFESLPNQFVLKCTHDSGGIVICKDKNLFSKASAQAILNCALSKDYYRLGREWPYKNVSHRIIAEKYVLDINSNEIKDYKVHCFNGKARLVLVCADRFSRQGLTEDFYDITWNHMNISRPNIPNSSVEHLPPKHLNEMIRIAEILATDTKFVRVDFYDTQASPLFGEITFYPASGFSKFVPESADLELGEMIKL